MNFDLLTNERLTENGSLYKTKSSLVPLPVKWNKVSVEDIIIANLCQSETLVCVNRGIVDYLENQGIRKYYKYIYIWIIESREIDYHLYSVIENCLYKLRAECRAGFVSDSQLLEKGGDFFVPISIGTISDSQDMVSAKNMCSITQNVKLFCSSKIMCLNHRLRINIGSYMSRKHTEFNFVLVKSAVQADYPSLRDQMVDCLYCVIIENLADPYYFTEKLIACFASRTVPILYGSCYPNIEELDKRGILYFHTVEDLEILMDSCDEAKYKSLSDSIEHNYSIVCQERYKSLEHQLAFSLSNYGLA